jgi:hypothetical protein
MVYPKNGVKPHFMFFPWFCSLFVVITGGRCKLLLEGAPFRVCSADEVRAWEETRSEKVQRALEAKERRLTCAIFVGWGGEKIAVKPWVKKHPHWLVVWNMTGL